jgi:hypothetical protein
MFDQAKRPATMFGGRAFVSVPVSVNPTVGTPTAAFPAAVRHVAGPT